MLLSYGIVFLAGPLVFVRVLKSPAVETALAGLVIAVVASMALDLLLQAPVPLAALGCLWLSLAVLGSGAFSFCAGVEAPRPVAPAEAFQLCGGASWNDIAVVRIGRGPDGDNLTCRRPLAHNS